MEQDNDCRELQYLWKNSSKLSQSERYFEISRQLCRYARQDSSPNSKSLIVFADTYEVEKDALLPNARKRALEAGADEYLCMTKNASLEAFFKLVEQRLGWKRS